ncbi:MAG TPA: amidohydrolase family protein [Patescibacteria group bacterium]|nr:amidohydrolase family protein [Patescibacteria group bacterium]
MIIDGHSHWLPEAIIQKAHFFSPAWGDIETQVRGMDETGIGKAVLSYPTSDAHLKLGGHQQVAGLYNDAVGKILKEFPDRFIGAAILPVTNGSMMLDELKRAVEELGFQALSLATSYDGMYLDHEVFLPVYKEAARRNLAIFVHSQITNPIGFERVQDPLLTPVIEYVFDTTICIGKLLMSGILEEYGQLKFVFAYYGGVTPFLASRFDTTYRMLRGINFVKDLKADPTEYLKRIYVDTSGDTQETNLSAALKLLGPGHILWGSDWPAKKDPRPAMAAVNNLKISQADKEGILGNNLAAILHLH